MPWCKRKIFRKFFNFPVDIRLKSCWFIWENFFTTRFFEFLQRHNDKKRVAVEDLLV